MTETAQSLKMKAARGAGWSAISSILLRLGSFIVGIVLARLLTPNEFGVYAVALTVQSILMTVADLGLSSDLIRSKEPERIAPTIATLGLISGACTAALTIATSGFVAETLGSAEAAPAISVLAFTLLLGGISLVPYAMLVRRFQQRTLFLIGAVDFVVSTVVTITLVLLGWGVMGLAVGRVAAQAVSSILQFVLAGVRPRFGIDRSRLRPILAFGLPIAGANLLMWGLLSVDNIILARMLGATALGFYVLAFNISNWPMNALSQSVRAVSMPYFSRADNAASGLVPIVGIGWAAALPAGAILAVLSEPLISVVYGEKWLPAAAVLAALGLHGAFRVLFDVFTGFLYARGRAQPVLWIQIVWLVCLVVAMVYGTSAFGIVGAGWAHVLVAAVIVLPVYALVVAQSGVSVRAMLRQCAWPTAATLPAAAAAWLCTHYISDDVAALLLGGAAAGLIYGGLMWRWGRRELLRLKAGG